MKKLLALLALVSMTMSVSAQSVRGDLNGDGDINTTDVTELYNIIFGTSVENTEQGESLLFTVGDVSFVMVHVPGGTFMMGNSDDNGPSGQKPAHKQTVGDFYIGRTEVTQALWEAVMGSNPSHFKGNNRPVEQVTWKMCQEFVTKLYILLEDQLPNGRHFRLPTEAEWEYAARGGNKSRNYKYSGSNNVGGVAWYSGNSGQQTHEVILKDCNELGIYDMSGNVSELVEDQWRANYNASYDPTQRVYRGGNWWGGESLNTVTSRFVILSGQYSNEIGLRLAL